MKVLKDIKDLDDNITHIILHNEVNYATYPDLKKLFSKIISDNKRKLLVDLNNVAFIDSSGLGAIASAHIKLNSMDGILKLINKKDDIRKILDITGLSKVIEIFPDLDTAIESIKIADTL
jgi:anti-anti-sigma factor